VSADPCGICFPAPPQLAALAENARAGHPGPFVGTGDPDMQLACAHGAWRLGDVIAEPAAACSETTKAGEPCKGTPGADGLCAAHKPKGDGDDAAGAPAGADQAQGQGQGQGAGQGQAEAGGGQEAGGEGPGA
jgi:hypothetical protein